MRTEHCLADALTKQSVRPEALIKAVETGTLPAIDTHPPFRSLLRHKAYLCEFLTNEVCCARDIVDCLNEFVWEDLCSFYAA